MGLFGHGGFTSKLYDKTVSQPFKYATFEKNSLHKADDAVQKIGGYGNLAMAAGIALAGVATGGAAWAAGYGAMAAYGAAGAGIAAGIGTGVSGYESAKEEKRAEAIAAAEQAEINKANALADAQRKANLLSLRKQVGAVNVGAKSTVFSGSSTTDNKNTATSVVLG